MHNQHFNRNALSPITKWWIDIDKVNKITGLDITFVTTAQTNEEAYELLKEMGMPFKNIKKSEN